MTEDHGDCGDAVHRLYHYLDGELDAERRRVIQGHLDACGECLGAFDFEAELRELLARRCRDRVPDELRMRIAMTITHVTGPFDTTLGGGSPL